MISNMIVLFFLNEIQIQNVVDGANGALGHRVQQHVLVALEIDTVFAIHHLPATEPCSVR